MNGHKMRFPILCLALFSLALFMLTDCSKKRRDKILLGLSMDTLKEERWQRDRNFFVARAEELGAQVIVQAANSDDQLQNAQAENMLTQGVKALVVIPHNGKTAAAIVESAHRSKVRVIAYDRIINDSDLDLYISFDNVKVGELQAQYLVSKIPRGDYVLIGGAPTDHNAKLLREGQMKVLRPYIERGDIKIVADQWANDWLAIEALKHTENALTQNGNRVDAIVASNDTTAGGVIQALAEQRLAGKILVSGQDADLAACQRIVDGTQAMTVYKPVHRLARRTAEISVALAKGEPIEDVKQKVYNGKIEVPSVLLTPIIVDKTNLADVVIKDGFHKKEDIFRN